MGLIANLKILWRNRKKIHAVSTEIDQIKGAYMKDGWKTSEFWLVVLSNSITLVETFKGTIDPKTAAIIITSLTAVFNIVRGFTKAAASVGTNVK